jgi:hydrogenase 3 maturation protease
VRDNVSFEGLLREWLTNCRKLVVLGIGNPLRRDDAVGLRIVRMLRNRVPQNVRLFECQTVPENFLGRIRRLKPSHVLMLDAAHFDEKPGVTRLVTPKEIAGVVVSTHALPLSMLAELIQKSVGAKVVLLGVQPRLVGFGEQLSPEIEKTSEEVADVLVVLFGEICA